MKERDLHQYEDYTKILIIQKIGIGWNKDFLKEQKLVGWVMGRITQWKRRVIGSDDNLYDARNVRVEIKLMVREYLIGRMEMLLEEKKIEDRGWNNKLDARLLFLGFNNPEFLLYPVFQVFRLFLLLLLTLFFLITSHTLSLCVLIRDERESG